MSRRNDVLSLYALPHPLNFQFSVLYFRFSISNPPSTVQPIGRHNMTALHAPSLTSSFLNFLTLTFQFSFFNFPFNELVVSLRAENQPTFAYETANVHIVAFHPPAVHRLRTIGDWRIGRHSNSRSRHECYNCYRGTEFGHNGRNAPWQYRGRQSLWSCCWPFGYTCGFGQHPSC